MKQTYENLELEVIRFRTEDIITTSQVQANDEGSNETSHIPNNYVYYSTEWVSGLDGEVDLYRTSGESADVCHVYYNGEWIPAFFNGEYYVAYP